VEERVSPAEELHMAVSENFPQDEPLFAASISSEDRQQAESGSPASSTGEDARASTFTGTKPDSAIAYGGMGVRDRSTEHSEEARFQAASSESQVGSDEWEREQKRLHQMNVAAVFGDEHTEEESHASEMQPAPDEPAASPQASAPGTMEEE